MLTTTKGVGWNEIHHHGQEAGSREELRACREKVGKIERLFRSGDSEAFITSFERGRHTAEVSYQKQRKYISG